MSSVPPATESAPADRLDLSADYFELFEQERRFGIDESSLAQRYRRLQGLTHPDRFAGASAGERRWSVQASSFVNDAYRTLRSPLSRAVYLLSLAGVATDEETDTRMDPAFLMQQMEWRESLDDARSAADPAAALDALERELRSGTSTTAEAFAVAADAGEWDSARDAVRRWQFLDKLAREIDDLAAELEER